MRLARLLPALLLALLPVGLDARQITSIPVPASTAATGGTWAFEQSDLPVDPDYRFGTLENGMRYIIRPNGTPAGQGAVQFWIDAGSLDETEAEHGFAHFVEHMAFNGSAQVPEGEMVRLLEREGLAFGADTNASTSFDNTVYKLHLPRNDPALLDTALMLMRETASELTFSPEAVEREKGVILSERRVRDTYDFRNTVNRLHFLYPDARFPERLPIGRVEAIEKATADELRAFWERLYRPENAAIIVVGDFDPVAVEAAIHKHFSTWEAAALPPKPNAGPVDFTRAGATDIYLDPALPERITATRHGPWLHEADTIANRRTGLLRQIGYGIVNRRLARLARTASPPFRSATFGTSDVFEEGRSTTLTVDAGHGEWEPALTAAVREYRRAFTFGFSEAEVAEQVANLRTALENAAAGAETRSNASFVNAALALLQDDRVPTTPDSALARFEALAPDITPETVMAALKEEAVPLEDPLLRFEGHIAPEGGAQALRAAWEAAMGEDVIPSEPLAFGTFAYEEFGPAGEIVSDRAEPLLGIRTITFDNGLMLNLRPTDLQRDRVSVELNIDGGLLLNTRENPLATAMTSVLPQGGLGRHSYDELQTILAGRSVGFSIAANGDAFTMGATTTTRDLELQLQLMAAALSDPGYRPQGEAQYRRNIENFFARRDATPSNALANALGGIISDNDPRFTLQSREDYLQLSFEQLRRNIGDRLSHGALELALVGDFDPDRAIALVARTLGALPAREPAFRDNPANRERSFTTDRRRRIIYHDGAPDQALVRMSWPTTDDSDFAEVQRLELLERVMRIELIDKLREELGQTYSPGVNASQSEIYKGYGTFNLAAAISLDDVSAAQEAMLETVEELVATPVSPDILLRARQPLLEAYDNALKTNRGWLSLAARAQSRPEELERFTNGKALLESLTPEDIREVAARYLIPEERLEIHVLPRPSGN